MSARSKREWLAANAWSLPLFSRWIGRLADLRLPRALLARAIRAYARFYAVDLEEAVSPPEAYATFNAFFTRRLKAGRRPLAEGRGVVLSPCDSLLSAIGNVPWDGRLEQIKGRDYSIQALLGGSADEVAPFCAGVHATLYLTPSMYHRVHSPVDGAIRSWRYVRGRLFPVNPAGVRTVRGLFTRNERVAVFIDSDAHGPVALVLVGASNVGRISLAWTGLTTNRDARPGTFTPERPVRLRRGDELGAFNLGSTVVMLLADPALVAAATAGEVVKMGQPLWRRVSKSE